MNIPNILTLSRIILTIPIVAFLYFEPEKWSAVSFAFFIIAALTDYFDGKLARKLNQVSTFGKFLDQISDKIMITSLLLIFMFIGKVDFWLVFVVLFRDTLVSGIRMLAASQSVVIAANYYGKAKTVIQMAFLLFLYFQQIFDWDIPMLAVTFQWLVALITVLSGVTYILDYRRNIERGK
ncbi:CDP-diacylglycerol--glycerol-3-phosphate 3-phosphatidyltransferase [Kosmotoga pacifica]|uniref:CDP-diacylglycerol--glycerol-3-phosphate 3-phosphatidyltransferase n=1 Tax=Kosmotoga pacifica TaxID=1330330 RepID=A0A0G2ZA56_9BACT|nr:CDP-diacylglycerol--glycerol-3-phosphate 3-phosphatidyltransferase [Kosmotoga pacifica]AKI96961.1 CDP-diacylglycerol--glycerol-3-phosphate 3-phosphatidyltransferase [Kosmotoga pacifica]